MVADFRGTAAGRVPQATVAGEAAMVGAMVVPLSQTAYGSIGKRLGVPLLASIIKSHARTNRLITHMAN